MVNNPSLNWEKLQNIFYRKIKLCDLEYQYNENNINYFATNTAVTIVGNSINVLDYKSEVLLSLDSERFGKILSIHFDYQEHPIIVTPNAIHQITDFFPLKIDTLKLNKNIIDSIWDYKKGYIILKKSQDIYKIENNTFKLIYKNNNAFNLITKFHWDINKEKMILLDINHVFKYDIIQNELKKIKDNSQWQRVIISSEGFICLYNEKFHKLQISNTNGKVLIEYELEASPIEIAWCGNDTIACLFDLEVKLFGPGGSYIFFWFSSMPIKLLTEIDGLRVFTKNEMNLITRVPEHLSNIFKIGSTEPAAVLLDSREYLEDYPLKAIANLRIIDVSKAVSDCIKASIDEFDIKLQKRLLEAASFGKSSIIKDAFDSKMFVDACERVKLLNALRNIGIFVTNDELNNMTLECICDILKLRNKFFYCLQLYKIINNLTEPPKIFTKWATVKLLSSPDQEDDYIYETIQSRLKEIPNRKDVQMVNIAHTAFLEGRFSLARRLSLLEQKSELKTMALLELDDENMALQEMLKTNSPELILSLLLKCQPKLTAAQFTKFLIFGMSEDQLFSYFEEKNNGFLYDYFRQTDSHIDLAHLILSQGVTNGSLQPFLQQIRDLYARLPNNSLIKEEISLFEKQNKLWSYQESLSSIYREDFTNLTLDKTLSKLIEMKLDKQLDDFIKKLKINEKRFYHCKCKTLIENKRFDELYEFAKERKSPIGYLPFYRYLFKRGHKKEASIYVEFMVGASVKDKIKMYLESENYLEAIKIAEKDGDLQTLKEISKEIPPEQIQLKNLANDVINRL